ncbi:MAG: phosphatase PAP2 family protein [Clostridia bacterium]|nr:phosphatase PAP2 family protein [Clostridia bacterium]
MNDHHRIKQNNIFKRRIFTAILFLLAFAVWTAAVMTLDVSPIGPNGSRVGLSGMNGFFARVIGVDQDLYIVTDYLGLIPIAVAFFFGTVGLIKWIKRKRITRVDRDILALGGLYLTVIAFYVLFELVVINRRPVLIDGQLEASYPSSTTMLVLSVMPAAALQCRARIKHKPLGTALSLLITAFTAFMLIGRLMSGVHWVSDIVGGVLLSTGLSLAYRAVFYYFIDITTTSETAQ